MKVTVRETGHIDGGAYRIVRLADGSERVEGWGAKGWTPGGATFGEIANAPPVSHRFAAELGIPMSDLPTTTPPTRPTRPTAAELERHPALLWHWMEAYWDHALLEALRELREEDERKGLDYSWCWIRYRYRLQVGKWIARHVYLGADWHGRCRRGVLF